MIQKVVYFKQKIPLLSTSVNNISYFYKHNLLILITEKTEDKTVEKQPAANPAIKTEDVVAEGKANYIIKFTVSYSTRH